MWFILSLFVMGLWGVSSVFEKVAVKSLSPFTLMFFRQLFVASFILSIFFFTKGRFLTILNPKAIFLAIGSGICGGLLGMWLYFKALKVGDVSLIVPITGSYPLVAALLAFSFLGEPLSLQRIIGISFIILGVALLR